MRARVRAFGRARMCGCIRAHTCEMRDACAAQVDYLRAEEAKAKAAEAATKEPSEHPANEFAWKEGVDAVSFFFFLA